MVYDMVAVLLSEWAIVV